MKIDDPGPLDRLNLEKGLEIIGGEGRLEMTTADCNTRLPRRMARI